MSTSVGARPRPRTAGQEGVYIHLSRIPLPAKILIMSYVMLLMAMSGNSGFSPGEVLSCSGKPDANWLLFVTWMNVVAAGSLTMVTDSAGFCRYTRRVDMWGTLLGKDGGGCFAALLGAYGGSDAGQDRQCIRGRFRPQRRLDLLAAA